LPQYPTESRADEPVRLGAGWAQVETAIGWVQFGVGLGLAGAFIQMVAALLSERGEPTSGQAGIQLPTGIAWIAVPALVGSSLFIVWGRLGCLRVPRNTPAHAMATLSLAATVLSLLCTLGMAFGLILVAVQGTNQPDWMALGILLVCLAAGVLFSLVGEFSFLAFMKRVGEYLRDQPLVDHAKRTRGLFVGVLVAIPLLACLGAFVFSGSSAAPQRPNVYKGKDNTATAAAVVTFVGSLIVGLSYLSLMRIGRYAILRQLNRRGPEDR
jgi:hypothetical protein